MNVERYLISKIVQDGDITTVTDAGISPRFFNDADSKRVFEVILEHVADYGQVPGLALLKTYHPNYAFVEVTESFQALIDLVRKRHGLAVLNAGLQDALYAHDAEDVDATVAALTRALHEVQSSVPRSQVVNLAGTGTDRLANRMAQRHLRGRLLGIPTGFRALDEVSSGWRPKQLVTFIGLPKAGKSMALLHSAIAAHKSGYRPLFIGFEMSNEEQFDRHDGLRAGINPAKLATLSITKAELKTLKRVLNQVDNLDDFFLSEDITASSTVSGIRHQIERYNPSIVFLDGVYMMVDEYGEPPNSPQALTNITRNLKRLAQKTELPIICATQALESKSRGQTLSTYSIGYTSSFAQDSDSIIAVERTDQPLIMRIRRLIGRDGPPIDLWVRRDLSKGLIEELDDNPDEVNDALAAF